ncbi:MAG TPA: hypothetical protein VN673_05845 [Clostridia bacterium]|nr:hypothetical protein [Clostridia bacterium]
MARILTIKDLEERKRALVAESEIYRQTLILEVQNVRLYAARVRRRYTWFRAYAPLVRFGAPFVFPMLRRSLFGGLFAPRHKGSRFKWIPAALATWQIYRKLAPMLGIILGARRLRHKPPAASEEESMAGAI